MYKKIIGLIMTVIFIVPFFSTISVIAENEIKVEINGVRIVFTDVKPEMINDRVFVPIRIISEYLGEKVYWNEETQKVTVGLIFDHKVGSSYIRRMILDEKFNQFYDIGVASYTKNNRTMVSVRLFAEGLKLSVDWNKETQTVVITSINERINMKKPVGFEEIEFGESYWYNPNNGERDYTNMNNAMMTAIILDRFNEFIINSNTLKKYLSKEDYKSIEDLYINGYEIFGERESFVPIGIGDPYIKIYVDSINDTIYTVKAQKEKYFNGGRESYVLEWKLELLPDGTFKEK